MDFANNTQVPQSNPEAFIQPNFKIFNFYYKGSCQKVKFFPGTPDESVLKLAFKLFNLNKLEPDLDLLIRSMVILDSDGVPVAFDASSIPNEEKLYMTFDYNFKSLVEVQTISKPVTKRFKWNKDWNNRVCRSRYTISESGTDVQLIIECPSMPVLISDVAYKKGDGVHKFRINLMGGCYCMTGIVHGKDTKNASGMADFGSNFRNVPSLDDTKTNSDRANFVLDMDKMQMEINEKKFALPDDEIYVAVVMKNDNSSAQVFFDD